MNPHTQLEIALAALALVALAVLPRRRKRAATLSGTSPLASRPLMTPNEREAYARLKAALPNLLVFPQVSLGTFIDPTHPRHRTLRNHYDRLVADFLICDATTAPIAVIEIDDRSHRHATARKRDGRKNAACQAAQLHMIRWPATPLPTPQAITARIADVLKARP